MEENTKVSVVPEKGVVHVQGIRTIMTPRVPQSREPSSFDVLIEKTWWQHGQAFEAEGKEI